MKKIVFFGAGNISQSIILGLIAKGYKKKDILYVDRNKENQKHLKKIGIKKYSKAFKDEVDLIFLAVKPKDALLAIQEICSNHTNPKVISLVAGIKSKQYFSISKNIQLIRAMPTTSSQFGKGITGVFNLSSSLTTFNKVKRIFNKVGMIVELSKEQEMDTFTGLIGSGPAYFFYLLKVYERRLMKLCNNDTKISSQAMVNMFEGIALSVSCNNIDELIDKVASKKGTTEAGLRSFKQNKLLNSFDKGIATAIKRSKEIANES